MDEEGVGWGETETETTKLLFQIYRIEAHSMTIKNVKLASHQIILVTKGKPNQVIKVHIDSSRVPTSCASEVDALRRAGHCSAVSCPNHEGTPVEAGVRDVLQSNRPVLQKRQCHEIQRKTKELAQIKGDKRDVTAGCNTRPGERYWDK